MKQVVVKLGLLVVAAILSFATFSMVFTYADEEPLFHYSLSDARYYARLGTALAVFWLEMAVGLVAGVLLRRLSVWWLLGVLWAALGLFFAFATANGWMEDMEFSTLSRMQSGEENPRRWKPEAPNLKPSPIAPKHQVETE